MKKILIVTENNHDGSNVNGVVTTFENLARELYKLCYHVKFVTPDNFKSVSCPTYKEIRLVINPWKIKLIINQYNPDYIHIATEGLLAFYTKWYLDKNKIPYSSSFHTKLPEYINTRYPFIKEKWIYSYLRKLHQNSKSVLVTTFSMYKELCDKGFNNLVIWGRGVNRNLFNSNYRNSRTYRLEILLNLLYVGRISPEKNIEAFLDLKLPYLHNKIVVGDGPLLEEYKIKYPNVKFLGKLTGLDLVKQYSNAHVLVFPSKTDTFGLVMLESIACGTPVAAYPVTGPIDIIRNGVTGYLSEDLAEAIIKCIDIDRYACEEQAKNFSWENTAEIFINNLVRI